MIVGLSHTLLDQNNYTCSTDKTLIYVGNEPFRRFQGHIAPSEHYIHTLVDEGHHVVVGTDFNSGLMLANTVKNAALWIIEVMMPVKGMPQQIITDTSLGLAAGPHLSQIILNNTNSEVILLAMHQPTSAVILNDLEKKLGGRGIVENALVWTPNDFAALVRDTLKDKTI